MGNNMKNMISQTELETIVQQCRPYAAKGKVADYIPQLGKTDPHIVGVSIMSCNGEMVQAGDTDCEFTLQSISKVFSLLLALEDWGEEEVFRKVGVEPSGDVFNSIRRLETNEDNKPHNPMINAGAIAIASMIKGNNVDERFSRIRSLIQNISGNPHLKMNEEVYLSERQTGDRNRSLAYFMKSTEIIETDVEEALDLYFRYNSIQVTCSDLARIGCFFASKGRVAGMDLSPVRIRHLRIAMAIMLTSGMYNASGQFAIEVGVPAKSGVSGGIFAVVPGRMGIGVLGPAIDDKGNSTAGLQLLKTLSERLSLSLLTNDLCRDE